MTLGEFLDCLNGHHDRIKEQDTQNYILGKYISVGVRAPSSYPQRPVLAEGEKKMSPITDDTLKRIAIMAGGKVKDGSRNC